MSDLVRVLVVLALVGANTFLVAAEFAVVVAARRVRLARRAERGSRGTQAALRRSCGRSWTLSTALRIGRSGAPAAEGSLDRLTGVIHARQLVAVARSAPAAPIPKSARGTLVVPEATDLGALLRDGRAAGRPPHHALLVGVGGDGSHLAARESSTSRDDASR